MNKKVFISFILLLVILFFPNNVLSKSVDAIRCDYTIVCKNGVDYTDFELAPLRLEIHDYNNNNNGAGFSSKNPPKKVYAYVQDNNQVEKSINLGDKITNYYFKNIEWHRDYKFPIYVLPGDKEAFNFAWLYSEQNACPALYCNTYQNASGKYEHLVDVIPIVDQYDNDPHVAIMMPINEYLKDNSVGKWQTREEFDIKAPKVCEYNDIEIMGGYYYGGLKNEKNIDLKLITNYDTKGQVKSYNIEFNGTRLITPITTLNEDVYEIIGESSAISVETDQLKKIFNQECGQPVYVYLKDLVISVYDYRITTDLNEAKQNMINEGEDDDYDSEFEMPDISLTPDSLDCVGILGRPDDNISKPPAFYLQTAFTVMKYVAIVILIVFTIMDYVGAVSAQDDDAIKKATSKLVTRLIICVILFVLPTLIEFLFKILDIYGDAAHCKIN